MAGAWQVVQASTYETGELGPNFAVRQTSPDSFIAAAAFEITRFVIPSRSLTVPYSRRHFVSGWRRLAQAVLGIQEPVEIAFVIRTRRPAAPDGSALRTGWLAIGRGADEAEAVRHAATAMGVVATSQAAGQEFLSAGPVRAPDALLEFAESLELPCTYALRKAPWCPRTHVDSDARAGAAAPFPPLHLVLPWKPTEASWAALTGILAASTHDAAFVVRAASSVQAPPQVVAAAQASVFAAAETVNRVLGARPDATTPIEAGLVLARQAALARLETVEGPSLLLDALVATSDTPSSGWRATLQTALLPARGQRAAKQLPAPEVTEVSVPPGSLLSPMDAARCPELLVAPEEALAFLRTPEPPDDERSPLPCSRARVLSLRGGSTVGTLLGEPERARSSDLARLDRTTRLQHVYMVGQTGSGKSTLMLRMALQDIDAGHGVTVLDPHGSLIKDLLDRLPDHRRDDVLLVDPTDPTWCVGLNPLEVAASDPVHYVAERDRIIDDLLDTFDILYDLDRTGGPIFEQGFRTFVSLVMGARRPEDYTPLLPMVSMALNSPRLSRALAERLKSDDPVLLNTLHTILKATGEAELRSLAPYVTSKLIRFYSPAAARRILCQKSTIDFGDVIASRKILLVELSRTRLGHEAAALLSRQVITRLSQAAMARPVSSDPMPHFLYADEFHHFASERFAVLLAEARKFGLGLTLAHQYTSQLVAGSGGHRLLDAVLGNAGTLVLFRVGGPDARLLSGSVSPRALANDISGLPNFMAIVRSVGLGNVPFTLRTLPPPAGTRHLTLEERASLGRRAARPYAEIEAEMEIQLQALNRLAEVSD